MKYNPFYYYMQSILLMLIFQSCKKADVNPEENETPQYTVAFTRHALEYVNLTEGKYFIYKDSATSLLDSVIVTKSKLENIFQKRTELTDLTSWGLGIVPGGPSYSHESFSLTLTKFIGSSQSGWLDAGAELELPVVTGSFASSDTAAMSLKLMSPSSYAGRPVFYLTESTASDISVVVEGTLYNNVIVVSGESWDPPSSQYYNKTVYYWAKGAGIIKYGVINGQTVKTFTLLRHN